MQSPTPPTKPTPPTPPSIKTSTGTPATDTHAPVTTTPQWTSPSKATSTSKDQSPPVPESTNNLPPLASYGTPTHTSKETTSEAAIPSTSKLSNNGSSFTGFSTFFVLIFMIAIGCVAVHWLKNYKPKQKSTINYATESSDDIVSLILSQDSFESATQVIPKTVPKKIVLKTEVTPKTKGNFEVRV